MDALIAEQEADEYEPLRSHMRTEFFWFLPAVTHALTMEKTGHDTTCETTPTSRIEDAHKTPTQLLAELSKLKAELSQKTATLAQTEKALSETASKVNLQAVEITRLLHERKQGNQARHGEVDNATMARQARDFAPISNPKKTVSIWRARRAAINNMLAAADIVCAPESGLRTVDVLVRLLRARMAYAGIADQLKALLRENHYSVTTWYCVDAFLEVDAPRDMIFRFQLTGYGVCRDHEMDHDCLLARCAVPSEEYGDSAVVYTRKSRLE